MPKKVVILCTDPAEALSVANSDFAFLVRDEDILSEPEYHAFVGGIRAISGLEDAFELFQSTNVQRGKLFHRLMNRVASRANTADRVFCFSTIPAMLWADTVYEFGMADEISVVDCGNRYSKALSAWAHVHSTLSFVFCHYETIAGKVLEFGGPYGVGVLDLMDPKNSWSGGGGPLAITHVRVDDYIKHEAMSKEPSPIRYYARCRWTISELCELVRASDLNEFNLEMLDVLGCYHHWWKNINEGVDLGNELRSSFIKMLKTYVTSSGVRPYTLGTLPGYDVWAASQRTRNRHPISEADLCRTLKRIVNHFL